ncbi:putative fad binding domain protein [Diplodia seriata]|uniref:Putative fad binding domain protein n=1 Tax=Diplodia seriata TaxID=420778 RepID=A0A0G2DQ61_9PEZI|nr:putative fad binding domain protein [Diplodia seriata]
MDVTSRPRQHAVPTTETSHPNDPIPHEPASTTKFNAPRTVPSNGSFRSSHESLSWSDSSDSEAPSTPNTEPMNDQQADELVDKLENLPTPSVEITPKQDKARRASTTLISEDAEGMRKLLGEGETGTKLIEKYCCGGGCCFVKTLPPDTTAPDFTPVVLPDNEAFRSLELKLGPLSLDTKLEQTFELPKETVAFDAAPRTEHKHTAEVLKKPPHFMQPHPPYNVFSAPVHHARELTKPGAQKRTFHFDIDVTDYPDEGGVDFKVGGAIGICPPNPPDMVDDVFDQLGVPKFVRDKPVTLKTQRMRWPTIWGDEEERELVTTRRELLTWCADLQSTPPTKQLLRLMAEHADALNERQILLYLTSAQGQAAFCDLRTGSHVTVPQLLHAFPSSRPPFNALLSVLPQLMPRFYSLSNDPHISSTRPGIPGGRRLIEMAVTIHEDPDWREGKTRTGVGSGFLERLAQQYIEAEQSGIRDPAHVLDLTVPMFRGLMANPLSRQFGGDGPMMLVGAGVGMAPFRGFILNRLKNANCANKIWLVQGVRDSMLDEIYSGELGAHEREIKKVVQSRRAGSNRKGMGEGVHQALIDVTMEKGNLNRDEAEEFWEKKKEGGQYIAETW